MQDALLLHFCPATKDPPSLSTLFNSKECLSRTPERKPERIRTIHIDDVLWHQENEYSDVPPHSPSLLRPATGCSASRKRLYWMEKLHASWLARRQLLDYWGIRWLSFPYVTCEALDNLFSVSLPPSNHDKDITHSCSALHASPQHRDSLCVPTQPRPTLSMQLTLLQTTSPTLSSTAQSPPRINTSGTRQKPQLHVQRRPQLQRYLFPAPMLIKRVQNESLTALMELLDPAYNNRVFHPRPTQVYMSKSDNLSADVGDCDWFKIYSLGPNSDTTWTTDRATPRYLLPPPPLGTSLSDQGLAWKHRQWYVNCAHVDIVGVGEVGPGPSVRIPEAYPVTDPGINYEEGMEIIGELRNHMQHLKTEYVGEGSNDIRGIQGGR
ncbi:hypothetical protein CC80DRAFT_568499 [Byssothecium circinans]|uniref:lytic cellulose monooxygenase (C4-dehydrogenating) n=1 Tax=Byssothecium circinans TaxID=147558 RepID=A0A6A5TNJ8_9PLEO|nr:hypothetical protein CC80DRAFT_568499 [Byssothecium circinans]